MYATHTIFNVAGGYTQEINDRLQEDMAGIGMWCQKFNVSVNASKTTPRSMRQDKVCPQQEI